MSDLSSIPIMNEGRRTIQSIDRTESVLELYIQSMTEKELKAYIIAKSHLGSSFDLGKSLGFIEWKKMRGL